MSSARPAPVGSEQPLVALAVIVWPGRVRSYRDPIHTVSQTVAKLTRDGTNACRPTIGICAYVEDRCHPSGRRLVHEPRHEHSNRVAVAFDELDRKRMSTNAATSQHRQNFAGARAQQAAELPLPTGGRLGSRDRVTSQMDELWLSRAAPNRLLLRGVAEVRKRLGGSARDDCLETNSAARSGRGRASPSPIGHPRWCLDRRRERALLCLPRGGGP